jgi:hypothetical protein
LRKKIGDYWKITEHEDGDGRVLDLRLGVKRRAYRQAEKKKLFWISSILRQAYLEKPPPSNKGIQEYQEAL